MTTLLAGYKMVAYGYVESLVITPLKFRRHKKHKRNK